MGKSQGAKRPLTRFWVQGHSEFRRNQNVRRGSGHPETDFGRSHEAKRKKDHIGARKGYAAAAREGNLKLREITKQRGMNSDFKIEQFSDKHRKKNVRPTGGRNHGKSGSTTKNLQKQAGCYTSHEGTDKKRWRKKSQKHPETIKTPKPSKKNTCQECPASKKKFAQKRRLRGAPQNRIEGGPRQLHRQS